VVQRRRELGIRLAVGARAADLLRMVLGNTISLAVAGIGLGLLASLATTRLLAGFLFGVGATDPTTLAMVGAIALLAVGAAGLGPASRAARTDPANSLRID
jgi:ABC-type antimicrobial peptide transport system permease subunit